VEWGRRGDLEKEFEGGIIEVSHMRGREREARLMVEMLEHGYRGAT